VSSAKSKWDTAGALRHILTPSILSIFSSFIINLDQVSAIIKINMATMDHLGIGLVMGRKIA
jgi:hypothetical protein